MPDSTTQTPSFLPAASWNTLKLRAKLLREIRAFFEQREFLEVETPCLSAESVVDRYLEPPRVELDGNTLYLQTSPELHMKRLLAAGSPSIYQIAKVFRAGEAGKRHNPEFTMLEWYGLQHSYEAGMTFLSDLVNSITDWGPARRLSYRTAFEHYAGLDPFATNENEFKCLAKERNISVPRELDRDGWLNLLLTELVEPHLGTTEPIILYDYPASQAALAEIYGENPPVAARFELYKNGIELANGYLELRCAKELLRRNNLSQQQRRQAGAPSLPEPVQLLAAMEHGLPSCTGAALGFDRLAMLLAGSENIADVLAFPIGRA